MRQLTKKSSVVYGKSLAEDTQISFLNELSPHSPPALGTKCLLSFFFSIRSAVPIRQDNLACLAGLPTPVGLSSKNEDSCRDAPEYRGLQYIVCT